MFRKNQQHRQPILICSVNELPVEQREYLRTSWAGVFYREFFCRLDEKPFAVLYADHPSRPNTPVNVLVGLEYLKAGFGWSDQEMYEAFLYNMQVRYAVGYDEFVKGYFDLRTLYYFRQRLSRHMQETGVNLLDQAFEQVTDEQVAAFQLKTGKQRMDSSFVASNIRQMGRLQLLVEVLQRVPRMLSEADQARYAEAFAPYVKGHAGQYVYRLKGEDVGGHLQQIGEFMQRLLIELNDGYGDQPTYQVLGRVFGEHYRVEAAQVTAKANQELSAASLQSPDDLEATYREKRGEGHRGYVTNLTETCDPQNPLQLITKVQVASNNTDDSQLLAEAAPNLKDRTELETIYTDGGYGGVAADPVVHELHITHIQTAIRGRSPNPEKLNLADFVIKLNETGKPVQITCSQEQRVSVHSSSQQKGFVAHFDLVVCQNCPFGQVGKCPAQPGKRDGRHHLRFTQAEAHASERRRKSQEQRKEGRNLRAAIEATVRCVKHPFPASKLPVRGMFRMTCMLIGSAAMTNVRRIQHYLEANNEPEKAPQAGLREAKCAPKQSGVSIFATVKALWRGWLKAVQLPNLCLGC